MCFESHNIGRLSEIPPPVSTGAPDTVIQPQATASAAAPTAGAGFEGLGTGLPGATVDAAPPDTNGEVGPNNYVQIVNEQFAVFSKTGSVLYGPADTNMLWSGFGGGCQTNNDGDATVNTTGSPNPGFETGTFVPWTTGGVRAPIIVSSGAHGGTYAARPGSTSPYNGNSIFQQTITVPAGGGTLSYWYNPHCPDTLTYDQQQVQIRNTAGTRLATVTNVCSNSGVWTQRTFNLASYAGQTVVLWFNVHDDNYPTDPSYMLVDDILIQ